MRGDNTQTKVTVGLPIEELVRDTPIGQILILRLPLSKQSSEYITSENSEPEEDEISEWLDPSTEANMVDEDNPNLYSERPGYKNSQDSQVHHFSLRDNPTITCEICHDSFS